jgi:hypothetical protein
MMTNEMLQLSTTQLAWYNAWATSIAAVFGEGKYQESLEIRLCVRFSCLVEASRLDWEGA